ncbi:hypothetical protein JY96_21305 [Aquabacterium sp. NJ1]|uniref:hypothetical protein n=1 Tax=Aquabacterium sp. NJ1 TaxID=1538295 RepID=UPI00052CFFD7|nr:hypothetical protein [Aquabacterium sp. NJ1]KGM38713.1 hypothetical protein JY96_21305 [Aquabacterium sp. NJ1]
MLEKLQIPTDSLWKFLAIFGLAGILASAYLFVENYERYLHDTLDAQAKLVEIESSKQVSATQAAMQKYLTSKVELLSRNKTEYAKMIAYLFSTSLAVLLFGSFFWVTKVQTHVDRMLAAQAMLAMREAKKRHEPFRAKLLRR